MQANESVIYLITKAGLICGSEYKLAQAMHVSHQRITAWKSGEQTCTPADRARLAGFAREDAVHELVKATIDHAQGTKKAQLQSSMGGWLHAMKQSLTSAANTTNKNESY